jgi:hypothetical protein
MSLEFNLFKAILNLGSAFSKTQLKDNKLILLLENNFNTLTILSRIAYLHSNKVLVCLEFKELVTISVLTNKYQAAQIISRWLSGYVEKLKQTVCKDRYKE